MSSRLFLLSKQESSQFRSNARRNYGNHFRRIRRLHRLKRLIAAVVEIALYDRHLYLVSAHSVSEVTINLIQRLNFVNQFHKIFLRRSSKRLKALNTSQFEWDANKKRNRLDIFKIKI